MVEQNGWKESTPRYFNSSVVELPGGSPTLFSAFHAALFGPSFGCRVLGARDWPWLSKPMRSRFGVGAPLTSGYFSGD